MQYYSSHNQYPSTVLITHYGDQWIRSRERSLLDLLTHIDRDKFRPVVWCNHGAMMNEVQRLNIPAIRSDFTLLFDWKRPYSTLKKNSRLILQGSKLVEAHGVDLIIDNSGILGLWLKLVASVYRTPLLTHQSVIAQHLGDAIAPKKTHRIENETDLLLSICDEQLTNPSVDHIFHAHTL